MKMPSRIAAWVLMIIVASPSRTWAVDDRSNYEAVVADVVLARPCWLVATVVGTALFVATLPVSALSRSVDKTARTLVVKPAHATFTRPLGDFSTVD